MDRMIQGEECTYLLREKAEGEEAQDAKDKSRGKGKEKKEGKGAKKDSDQEEGN